MMKEQLPTQEQERLELDETSHSWRIAEAVAETAPDINARFPECAGATMYGSVVRGAAREDSDADLMVLMEITDNPESLQANPWVPRNELVAPGQGVLASSRMFHDGIRLDYQQGIRDLLHAHGVLKADIDVLPVSEDIIEQQGEYLLRTAAEWTRGERATIDVPRNVRALFHAPINDVMLGKYQRQLLEQLSVADDGAAAWEMVRRMVIGFEAGRGNNDFSSATWREVPDTLEAAMAHYTSDNPPEHKN